MQKAFEKIVERLEENKAIYEKNVSYESRKGSVEDMMMASKAVDVFEDAIEIVNQVAEEYNKNIENSYINRTEVLKLIEYIKCDDSVPKNYGTLLDIMRQIRKMPTVQVAEEYKDKFVGIGAYQQVAWERDIAISQLKELGYEFGEKIREEEVCEWKTTDYYLVPKCELRPIVDVLAKEFKYCPYCGKKIKVVE